MAGDSFNNYLRDQSSYIEFTGEKFVHKPMDLFKLSLADLTKNVKIVTTDIQVQKMQKIYHIKVTISSEVTNTYQSGKLISKKLCSVDNYVWFSSMIFLDSSPRLGEKDSLFPRQICILFAFCFFPTYSRNWPAQGKLQISLRKRHTGHHWTWRKTAQRNKHRERRAQGGPWDSETYSSQWTQSSERDSGRSTFTTALVKLGLYYVEYKH